MKRLLQVPLAERLLHVALAGGLEARLKHGEQRSDGAAIPGDVLPGEPGPSMGLHSSVMKWMMGSMYFSNMGF